MVAQRIHAVFLFPQAVEALGDAIRPYLTEGPGGAHLLCLDVDTGGAFCELRLQGRNGEGKTVDLELMIPTAMIRLIVAVQGEDGGFGFA